MQQEDIKNTTTEEASANEQEVKEETAAEETVVEEAKEEQAEAKEEAVTDEKDEKITELNNRLMRLQADFDNFRRRTAGEKEQLSGFVTAGVVGKFLKVLDNFERAEASAEKTADLEGLLTGMKQIRRQFEETFKELGVEEIVAQDAKFDPNLHEAVMRGQNPELEDETIDMVFEKGYKLRDRVIRHSKVRVISND
ncbi:MAG: nucleotide exchange factor GrpE [Acidaminococcaceae bacterium]|nr:nucleotide exchange factor GrpE [Acidaminococcaceae bacterium]